MVATMIGKRPPSRDAVQAEGKGRTRHMSNTISVMNAKGGVGKSTMVMAIAETLSAYHNTSVLIIDSDAQASVSSMFMPIRDLHRLQSEQKTLVDYMVHSALNQQSPDWRDFVVHDVSDVDDARSISILPSDMQLTLFEREISKTGKHSNLRRSVADLLAETSQHFDCVLVDCAPGLSVMTECWLRETAYHLSPTKADYVSICGLEVFRRFQALNPEMGFADNLGVLINMREAQSATEAEYETWLKSVTNHKCFGPVVPRAATLQDAARYQPEQRSYFAKYPGNVGVALRAVAEELLARLNVRDRNGQSAHGERVANAMSAAHP